jgi:TPR repeat protein
VLTFKRLATVVVLLIAVSGSSIVAQVLTQPPARGVPDERFRSDIKQLLEVTGFERQSAQVMTIILTQLVDEAKKSQPNMPAGALEVMKQVIESEFAAATKGPLMEQTVAAYARYFTPDEVRGLLAFYNSELGKRTVAVMPAMTQELAASGQRWVEAELPRIRAGIAFRLRKEAGFDTSVSPAKVSTAQTDYEEAQKYLRGDGVAVDPSKAATLFQRACDGGVTSGCVSVGLQYANGNGVARDDARAVALYSKACVAQDSAGCADLGFMTENGRGIARDVPGAAALYQKACDGGNMYGCSNLSNFYAAGRGVVRDDVRSVALAQRACDGNYTIGCRYLASMYERGRGIGRDEQRAIALYQRACDGRDWPACDALGRMYSDGRGVNTNSALAITLFQGACDGAYAQGCGDLARMYADGRNGIAKDEGKAATLYQKACDGASTSSCARLGSMYEFGMGVDRDIKRAIELYQIACKANDQTSCVAVTRLAQQ